jgi:6-phosphofructokinase 2
MKPIVTLTMNPTIDAFCCADEILPVRKVRTRDEHYAAGGGGINVSRLIHELGGETVAFYVAGGLTGQALDGMVQRLDFPAVRMPIAKPTRVSLVVLETSTGEEYRFTPEGPEVSEEEWRECLKMLAVIDADYFVASGSLARGMPADFYAQVAHQVKERGGRVIVDTSGAPLHWALEEGVYLIKPSRRELEHLLKRKATNPGDEEAMAQEVVRSGRVAVVALTLGSRGAVLATAEGTLRLTSPQVETRSAVGAGDGFLGAMVWALATGRNVEEAFALGVSAGAATAASAGTGIASRTKVEELYGQVEKKLPRRAA